jgi:hypothetical protein
MTWRDLDEAAAEERVLRGESLLVLGIAGTGKTHYVQGIVERLRRSGKRVDIVSKTHTASRRACGVTAKHWVRRHVLHGSATCDYLWLDEVSQTDVGLLNQLAKFPFTPVRFLPSGDFISSRRSLITGWVRPLKTMHWSGTHCCTPWRAGTGSL